MTFDKLIEMMQTACVCGDGDWIESPDESGCEVNDVNKQHGPVLGRNDVEWVICSRCRGDGTLGGYPGVYTADDFAEDPDFYEDYMSHTRSCEDCEGTGKIREITDEAAAGAQVQGWLRDWWETEAIYAMERRMGA